MKRLTILALFLWISFSGFSQNMEDLLDTQLLGESKPDYVTTAFKSVQLINGHTTKLPEKGDWVLLISHRFGPFNSGFSSFWGLDMATMRLGIEYGLTNTTSVGFGRSSYKANYDLYAKQLLLRQTNGDKSVPLTLGISGSANVSSAKWPDDGRTYLFAHRMSYSLQLLASRMFSRKLTLQLMPTFVHRNLVKTPEDHNDIYAIGAGGRMKVSNRVAITAEYHYLIPGQIANEYENPLSLGVDIETGGHVFQLFVTNTSAIYEAAYIPETTASWLKGEVRFGFNISRTF
ncbi:MAG TPA: DUF5777 family beta-barrel protein [Prolixibacteraceae bacterium]|nr:DUF5777 family beta-barrel protein [Prolixibacteraceae bacterium]